MRETFRPGYMYINQSLTPDTRELLKMNSQKAKRKHFRFKKYIVKVEIRVKKDEKSYCITIKCYRDL